MQIGAITGYIDVAQVSLYVFWLFFAGLIFYLRKEDKREGYPLVTENPDRFAHGFPVMPAPKTFLLPNGDTVYAPRNELNQPSFNAEAVASWFGAPMQPLGDPLLAGAGPAASALRADVPEQLQERPENRVVPLRVATDHALDAESPDPRGKEAIGADGVVGGVVSDIWIDRAETHARYVEVQTPSGKAVLVPMPLVKFDSAGRAIVQSVMGAQFANAPTVATPDQITLREEDRVQAYFAAGNLYAAPDRTEPVL